jgi:hypothetical protein
MFKTNHSAGKAMTSVFGTVRVFFLVDFMHKGTTINAEVYCNTLKKLRRAIQNRIRGMLTRGISLLPDNARPHTAPVSQELLTSFGWDIVRLANANIANIVQSFRQTTC